MKELQVDYFSVVFSGLKSNYQNTVKYVENVSLQHFIWFGKQKMQFWKMFTDYESLISICLTHLVVDVRSFILRWWN